MKAAVLGTGAIGHLLGAYMSRAGEDVMMVSVHRRETAEYLNENGIDVDGVCGRFHTDVRAAYVGALENEKFDFVFVAMKGNDNAEFIPKMLPHLSETGVFVHLQNGLNCDELVELAGAGRVLGGVSFAGGQVMGPGKLWDHDGRFVVGELDGTLSARAAEAARLLGAVRPSEAVTDVRMQMWSKLATVAVHVPCCTLTGLEMGMVFEDARALRCFAMLAGELLSIAEADGCPLGSIMGLDSARWDEIAEHGPQNWLPPTAHFPPGARDAYTRDMESGLPLELKHVNGAVMRKAREHGLEAPANALLIEMVDELEAGRLKAGADTAENFIARALELRHGG